MNSLQATVLCLWDAAKKPALEYEGGLFRCAAYLFLGCLSRIRIGYSHRSRRRYQAVQSAKRADALRVGIPKTTHRVFEKSPSALFFIMAGEDFWGGELVFSGVLWRFRNKNHAVLYTRRRIELFFSNDYSAKIKNVNSNRMKEDFFDVEERARSFQVSTL